MSAPTSRAVYEVRMHRVLAYIDAHISEPLQLASLVEVAAFSPYHFHRLFAAWTGERMGDFVRRRRLELAASRLVSQPALSVLSVALSVGFGSAEAFARAFKSHFGLAPTAWRRREARQRVEVRKMGQPESNLNQAASNLTGQDEDSSHPDLEQSMEVHLEKLESVPVAYLRHTGPYGETVNRFWTSAVYPWMRANGLLDRARYGISHDDPSIAPPSKCRYDACVEVAESQLLTGKALRTILPGGPYALLDFKGTATQIVDAWSALLRDWLPSSGLQLDVRPCFEYYPMGSRYDSNTGEFECQICIPVASLY